MNLEEQISELEIQSAHQERHIADLNEVVVDQQKRIDYLEQRLLTLETVVKSNSSSVKDQSDETPPPHY